MSTQTMPAPRAADSLDTMHTPDTRPDTLTVQAPEFRGGLMLAAFAALTVAWVAGWVALAVAFLPAVVTVGIVAFVAVLLVGGLTVAVFAEASGEWVRGASYTPESLAGAR